MADLKEARVPDIGGHGDVSIIELLVKVGDTVAIDQGLVTLESDKATMEVPSPFAGVIKELKVKLGDNVSEGALVAIIEVAAAAATAAAPAPVEPEDRVGATVRHRAVHRLPSEQPGIEGFGRRRIGRAQFEPCLLYTSRCV